MLQSHKGNWSWETKLLLLCYCTELVIVLPFEMVILKTGTMSETTRSQLPSSKQHWRVKTAIKQQQEVDKGWELHDNLTSLLLYSD